ncbi:MAG: A/G-specific adenine glycosylase [Oscillospiraceae bacterium]|nr:A/G-specific adenine glycosylase [Oscillospiraceae bacterium]
MQADILEQLPQALLPWYEENKRDLPWRQDREPYHIWLSEIMLQQTRVEAVKGYYARFLEKLPAIEGLAGCDDDTLHKLWEGLGYYSRVRNLKKAAIRVMEDYGGRFPGEYEDVLSLPGIGDYTAGAICSIAFNRPTPAVDGNVLRVIARITEDDTPIDLPAYKKAVRQRLAAIYPEQAGDFTQALMELGATLCGPNWKPRCEECPCKDFCGGYRHGTAERFPVKLPKKGRRVEEMTVFIACCDGHYALRKRPDTGLLAGLWEFPHIPGKPDTEVALEAATEMGLRPRELLRSVERKHIFTHIEWQMRGYYLETTDCTEGFVWLTAEEIRRDAALPTAFRQFWEEIDHV